MPFQGDSFGQFALGQFLSVGTAALIGVAATGFAGQITPSDVLSLTGVSASAVAGSLTPRASSGLSGVAATGVAGSLAPDEPILVIGASATGVAGSLVPQDVITLTGAAATGAAGTLTPQSGTLPSTFATGVPGQLAPDALVGLVGAFGTGVAGTLVTQSANLMGVAATGVAGTLVPDLPFPLVGASATGAPGSFSFANPVILDSAVAFGVPGMVFDAIAVQLQATGVFATAVPGDIIVPRGLTGVSATGVPGIIRVQSGAGVTPIACVIEGRGAEAFLDGRASYATIVGRDCGCNAMKVHKPEYFQQGDTWQLQGNLHYADGTPFNLGVGCSIEWGLQNSAGQVIFTLALNAGITVLDPVNGICLITVTPAQSDGIIAGAYVDQLQATDPSGLVSTQWTGPISVAAAFF